MWLYELCLYCSMESELFESRSISSFLKQLLPSGFRCFFLASLQLYNCVNIVLYANFEPLMNALLHVHSLIRTACISNCTINSALECILFAPLFPYFFVNLTRYPSPYTLLWLCEGAVAVNSLGQTQMAEKVMSSTQQGVKPEAICILRYSSSLQLGSTSSSVVSGLTKIYNVL